MKKYIFIILIVLAVATACSEGDEAISIDDSNIEESDAGEITDIEEATDVDDDDEQDVQNIDDTGSTDPEDRRCGDAIINAWPLNDMVTTGDVNSDVDGDVWEMSVDASAGGFNGVAQNPFVYVRLDTGERVDITDIEALDNNSWDLAFRRTALRTNSSDSGPGSVHVAKIVGAPFEDVDEAPAAANRYESDVSFDEDCEPITDSIGSLFTAFNHLNLTNQSGTQSWYDYSSNGGMSVEPTDGDIYVVRNDDRARTYKLEIMDWDDGTYTIRWAELAPVIE